MSQSFDASKSLTTLEQDNTVIAVIEMSQSKWLVAAVVPGSNASRSRSSRPTRKHC
jgi:transposase